MNGTLVLQYTVEVVFEQQPVSITYTDKNSMLVQ